MALPSWTPSEVLAAAGLPIVEAIRSPKEGIVHAVWFCGPYVVRILKNEEEWDDTRTEALSAPVAWRAGVNTPEPVAFLEGASIFRRAEGVRLSDCHSLGDPEKFFRLLGHELSLLHGTPVPSDPDGVLDEAWVVEATPHLDRRWVFCHQDLHAENILVTPDERPVLLDWGDAGLGDPAADFRFVPVRYLDATLQGYREDSLALRLGIAQHWIDQAAYARETGRDYGPYGQSDESEVNAAYQVLLSRIRESMGN